MDAFDGFSAFKKDTKRPPTVMFTVDQFSLGYRPLAGGKRGEKESEEESGRESERDGEGNSEIAVLNALETQRKKRKEKRSTMVFQDLS